MWKLRGDWKLSPELRWYWKEQITFNLLKLRSQFIFHQGEVPTFWEKLNLVPLDSVLCSVEKHTGSGRAQERRLRENTRRGRVFLHTWVLYRFVLYDFLAFVWVTSKRWLIWVKLFKILNQKFENQLNVINPWSVLWYSTLSQWIRAHVIWKLYRKVHCTVFIHWHSFQTTFDTSNHIRLV